MPSDRGYVLFWRKTWDSKILKDPGHTFSRREAWIYLFTNLAQGIDKNGVGRGEFIVSVRYLAKTWLWSKSKVERFIDQLVANSMIARVGHLSGHLSGHFKISNYETYQKPWDTKRDTKRDISNKGLNESIKVNPFIEGGFAKFWASYPRKVGKGAAEKSWLRIHPTQELIQTIILAIESQQKSEQWTKNNGEFIPHPATWLNQRRWEDEIRTEVSLHDQLFGKR